MFHFEVALNFQTPGCEMDLNHGRFLVNGRCGYVLKPSFLRSRQTSFDPESGRGPGHRATLLLVKVQRGGACVGVRSGGAWSVGLCQMAVQQGCVGAHATWLVCARGGAQSCECRGPGPCPACCPPPGLGQLCCCPCSSFPREGDGASSEGTTPHIVASPLPRSNPTSLQVITAQQLPKLNNKKSSIVDPFVRVEIHGVRADCSSKQTEYKLNNGEWATDPTPWHCVILGLGPGQAKQRRPGLPLAGRPAGTSWNAAGSRAGFSRGRSCQHPEELCGMPWAGGSRAPWPLLGQPG